MSPRRVTNSQQQATPAGAPGRRRGAARRRRGLSLVEVMFALAITATLLTAAAVAFNVSSDLVQDNDRFFRATQSARISMHQILTQVRRGSVSRTWDATTLRLVTAADAAGNDEDLTYKFVTADKQIVLITNDNPSDSNYVLANDVTDLKFDVEEGEDYTKAPCVVRVTVYITVKVGRDMITLSGSAAPRRNLVY
jgi:prepilin-type N-terminal cleavage/methylation domain-containing protein